MNLKHFWVFDNDNQLFGTEFWDIRVFVGNNAGTFKVFKNQFTVSRCWNREKENSFWIPEFGTMDWTIKYE